MSRKNDLTFFPPPIDDSGVKGEEICLQGIVENVMKKGGLYEISKSFIILPDRSSHSGFLGDRFCG